VQFAGGGDSMASAKGAPKGGKAKSLYNVCPGCGAYVDVGVDVCPNCKTTIVNRHSLVIKYEDNIVRAVGGVLAGALIWMALYIAGPASLTRGWAAIPIGFIPLVCAGIGWFLGFHTRKFRLW